MKLKGINSKKLSKKDKKKKQETLDKMTETRKEDDLFLRETIKQKLEWALAEKEKGNKTVLMLENNLKAVKVQINKIDGIILILKELEVIKKSDIEEKEDDKS